MQAPKNGPQSIEVPIDGIKSMVTAVSDSQKGIDPTTRLAAEDAKLPVRTLPAYVLNQVSRQMPLFTSPLTAKVGSSLQRMPCRSANGLY